MHLCPETRRLTPRLITGGERSEDVSGAFFAKFLLHQLNWQVLTFKATFHNLPVMHEEACVPPPGWASSFPRLPASVGTPQAGAQLKVPSRRGWLLGTPRSVAGLWDREDPVQGLNVRDLKGEKANTHLHCKAFPA